MAGDMTLFTASQFNQLGGISALARFEDREEVFEALRQSTLVRQVHWPGHNLPQDLINEGLI